MALSQAPHTCIRAVYGLDPPAPHTGVARERRGRDDEPPEEAEPAHPRGAGILQDDGADQEGAWDGFEADLAGGPVG